MVNEGKLSLDSNLCRLSRAEKSLKSELEKESSLSVSFFQTEANCHKPSIESCSIPLPDFLAAFSSDKSFSKFGEFSNLLSLRLAEYPPKSCLPIFLLTK